MSGTTSIIIFGASGDLTRRKLIPSLLNLFCKDRMPENWQIIGVSRTKMSDEEFRQGLKESMLQLAPEKFNEKHWQGKQNNT